MPIIGLGPVPVLWSGAMSDTMYRIIPQPDWQLCKYQSLTVSVDRLKLYHAPLDTPQVVPSAHHQLQFPSDDAASLGQDIPDDFPGGAGGQVALPAGPAPGGPPPPPCPGPGPGGGGRPPPGGGGGGGRGRPWRRPCGRRGHRTSRAHTARCTASASTASFRFFKVPGLPGSPDQEEGRRRLLMRIRRRPSPA